MAELDSLDEALQNVSEATALRVDFSEGKTLTDAVGDLRELTALHLRKVPPDLELPKTLLGLPKLTTLSMTAAGDELVIPKLAYELRIDDLAVWDCDVKKLVPFKSLRSLEVVVKDPKREVAELATILPNLVRLEIWGSHLKNGELPDAIEKFTKLEELALVSCGLTTLPDAFARLTQLQTLRMRGLPMTKFPEVVCDLENLRTLEMSVHLTGLPPAWRSCEICGRLIFTEL